MIEIKNLNLGSIPCVFCGLGVKIPCSNNNIAQECSTRIREFNSSIYVNNYMAWVETGDISCSAIRFGSTHR